MHWQLDQVIDTRAGVVAAGKAGDGEALVLAHGWPWSSYAWHRVIPALAQRYRVHWYDMPGYGRSGTSADQRTSLDVQGEVFAEMLAHWRLDRPTDFPCRFAPRRLKPYRAAAMPQATGRCTS